MRIKSYKKLIATEFIEDKIHKKFFSGSAVIAGHAGKKSVEIYRGTLSSELQDKINAFTYFDIQSITKSVATSPLVHVLIGQKKIQLQEHIPGTQITIAQLLTHTAGYSDEDLPESFKNIFEGWKKIFEAQPRTKPGEKVFYADLNYRILGRYLELKMNRSLQDLCRELIWNPLGIEEMSYIPFDTFNTAGVPRTHGRIDDKGVHAIGSVVGDDGVFATARALEKFLHSIYEERGPLKGYKEFLLPKVMANKVCDNFYDSLREGTKNYGWEINEESVSYAGPLTSSSVIEKSGGAGTFCWLDLATGDYMIYLTNHGKPEPFKKSKWNKLVGKLAPHELSVYLQEP